MAFRLHLLEAFDKICSENHSRLLILKLTNNKIYYYNMIFPEKVLRSSFRIIRKMQKQTF